MVPRGQTARSEPDPRSRLIGHPSSLLVLDPRCCSDDRGVLRIHFDSATCNHHRCTAPDIPTRPHAAGRQTELRAFDQPAPEIQSLSGRAVIMYYFALKVPVVRKKLYDVANVPPLRGCNTRSPCVRLAPRHRGRRNKPVLLRASRKPQ